MADNELMSDDELDAVVGGTGAETLHLMNRLQNEGLAKFNTPLTAGNEAAAAAELQNYFRGFGDKFLTYIHADDTKNVYGRKYDHDVYGCYLVSTEDEIISAIKAQKGM